MAHFEPGSFHLVYSRNALDHMKDPKHALEEMLQVVKIGHPVRVVPDGDIGEREKSTDRRGKAVT